jgi:hypothetical protein
MRRLCLALLLIAPLSAADEIDVITLKGGRVVEGIYDPGSGNIEIMIGKMKGQGPGSLGTVADTRAWRNRSPVPGYSASAWLSFSRSCPTMRDCWGLGKWWSLTVRVPAS